jgi:hypothetical protein
MFAANISTENIISASDMNQLSPDRDVLWRQPGQLKAMDKHPVYVRHTKGETKSLEAESAAHQSNADAMKGQKKDHCEQMAKLLDMLETDDNRELKSLLLGVLEANKAAELKYHLIRDTGKLKTNTAKSMIHAIGDFEETPIVERGDNGDNRDRVPSRSDEPQADQTDYSNGEESSKKTRRHRRSGSTESLLRRASDLRESTTKSNSRNINRKSRRDPRSRSREALRCREDSEQTIKKAGDRGDGDGKQNRGSIEAKRADLEQIKKEALECKKKGTNTEGDERPPPRPSSTDDLLMSSRQKQPWEGRRGIGRSRSSDNLLGNRPSSFRSTKRSSDRSNAHQRGGLGASLHSTREAHHFSEDSDQGVAKAGDRGDGDGKQNRGSIEAKRADLEQIKKEALECKKNGTNTEGDDRPPPRPSSTDDLLMSSRQKQPSEGRRGIGRSRSSDNLLGHRPTLGHRPSSFRSTKRSSDPSNAHRRGGLGASLHSTREAHRCSKGSDQEVAKAGDRGDSDGKQNHMSIEAKREDLERIKKEALECKKNGTNTEGDDRPPLRPSSTDDLLISSRQKKPLKGRRGIGRSRSSDNLLGNRPSSSRSTKRSSDRSNAHQRGGLGASLHSTREAHRCSKGSDQEVAKAGDRADGDEKQNHMSIEAKRADLERIKKEASSGDSPSFLQFHPGEPQQVRTSRQETAGLGGLIHELRVSYHGSLGSGQQAQAPSAEQDSSSKASSKKSKKSFGKSTRKGFWTLPQSKKNDKKLSDEEDSDINSSDSDNDDSFCYE